jgi:hypothetical protein
MTVKLDSVGGRSRSGRYRTLIILKSLRTFSAALLGFREESHVFEASVAMVAAEALWVKTKG